MWVPPTLDVPGPPPHLGADHVGARANEAEADEEGDEVEELGLAARVDDRAVVDAADAGDSDEHEKQPSGAGRRKDDLADVAALLDDAVRVGGALERERLGHDRLQAPALEPGEQRLDARGRGCPRGPTSGAC